MENASYFKDLLKSIHDFKKKILLLIFLIQNNKNLLEETGFSRTDIDRLSLSREFKNILIEQHEEYLYHVKNMEE